MSRNKIVIGSGIIAVLLIALSGCYKTTLLQDNSAALTKTVSFSTDIQPILTTSCAKSGCHDGSVAPNLIASNAYNSLSNGSFLNVSSPSSSEVYLWLTGKRSATMPMGSANNPSNLNGLILAWITQGAKKN